jgi:hypothetical protein
MRAGAGFAIAFACVVALTLAVSASQTSPDAIHRGVFKPADSGSGNTSAKKGTATASADSSVPAIAAPDLSVPQVPASRSTAPTFAWAPQPGAIGYEVQFFKGRTRVLVRRTTEPRLSMPAHWLYDGQRFQLTSGRYRWYVWAIRPGGRPGGTGVKQQRAAVASSWTSP